MAGPKRRADPAALKDRLRKVLAFDPDLSYDVLEARGFPRKMVKEIRDELGLGPPPKTPYITRKEMGGVDVPGPADPYNNEPGRYRQKRFSRKRRK